MKLKTCLTLSCPDGKPTEEPAKGRGRGFGGESSLTLDHQHKPFGTLICSIHTCKAKGFLCVSFKQNQKYILCYNCNFEFKAHL